MKIDTNAIISITEANQNFSKASRMAENHGRAFIFKNNKARFLLVDLEALPMLADITEDELVDVAAARVMKGIKPALKELAK